ncbi:MAG: hypothetical protein WC683_15715 [bacterium]
MPLPEIFTMSNALLQQVAAFSTACGIIIGYAIARTVDRVRARRQARQPVGP